jgi:hypothetical protein
MKQLTLILASALFISVTAASAQAPTTDTTKNKSGQQGSRSSSDQMKKDKSSTDKSSTDSRSTTGSSSSTSAGSSSNSSNGERVLVRAADVPANLRQSLQGSEYSGWESGKIYKIKSGEYLLEMDNNGTTKTHRFNASGKPIKD